MQSGNNTSAMTRDDEERDSRTCIFNVAKVVETKDIVRCTGVLLAQSNDKNLQKEEAYQIR